MNLITTDRLIQSEIKDKKYVLIDAAELKIDSALLREKEQFWESWNDLEPDSYLKDGASYRLRRFGLFYWDPKADDLRALPPAPYFQSYEINRYAGGINRQFKALSEETKVNQFLHAIIKFTFQQFPLSSQMLENPWEVDVHQFRIISADGEEGEPTPEGIHHDDDDFNAIYLVRRQNVRGGINSVYDNQQKLLANHTLHQPMDSILLWDPHVMHGVSPISPIDLSEQGIRDVLVIGFNYNPAVASAPSDETIH